MIYNPKVAECYIFMEVIMEQQTNIDKIQDILSTEISQQNGPDETKTDTRKTRKLRKHLPFPSIAYEDCLVISKIIWEHASGKKMKRLTLFDFLGKSPDSGSSRALITNSSKYDLTTGSYHAEYIEMTATGWTATNPDIDAKQRTAAGFSLAIANNDYFDSLYQANKDMKIPAKAVMVDLVSEKGLDKDECKKCVELFLANARYLGLIKVISGSERMLTIENLLEDLSKSLKSAPFAAGDHPLAFELKDESSAAEDTIYEIKNQWDKVCFYVTPIGDDGSEERKHSDLFLSSIVEPALEDFGLKVVRADKISNPGMITSQVIEHIMKAKLVIADLSYNNPNVFYELSLRHTQNLPTIHIIRKQDKIPFDLQDFRTIVIDTTDIYTFVPQLESYKTEISLHARKLLENPEAMENPISTYLQKTKR
jgi:hypothetical protein